MHGSKKMKVTVKAERVEIGGNTIAFYNGSGSTTVEVAYWPANKTAIRKVKEIDPEETNDELKANKKVEIHAI